VNRTIEAATFVQAPNWSWKIFETQIPFLHPVVVNLGPAVIKEGLLHKKKGCFWQKFG
jgi:hypothetical protein